MAWAPKAPRKSRTAVNAPVWDLLDLSSRIVSSESEIPYLVSAAAPNSWITPARPYAAHSGLGRSPRGISDTSESSSETS